MPEQPEIKRAADQIAGARVGGNLASVHLNCQVFEGDEHAFENAAVSAVTARGKANFAASSTGLTMYSHNQLCGVRHLHPYLQKPGPDVLAGQTSTAMLGKQLRSKPFRNRTLAALYLDQGCLAGIGN